jgi:hypothetical protein
MHLGALPCNSVPCMPCAGAVGYPPRCLAWIHDTLHITPVSMQTKQVNMFGKVSENEFANGGLTVRNEFANGGLTVCT